MTTHSPIPWHWSEGNHTLYGADFSNILEAYEDYGVVSCNPSLHDAEFIVRAVNSHDALVEALRGYVDKYPESPGTYTPEGAAARAALKRAEGQS